MELFTVAGQSPELDAWLAAKGWYVNKDVRLAVPAVSLECVRGGGMLVLAGETVAWDGEDLVVLDPGEPDV